MSSPMRRVWSRREGAGNVEHAGKIKGLPKGEWDIHTEYFINQSKLELINVWTGGVIWAAIYFHKQYRRGTRNICEAVKRLSRDCRGRKCIRIVRHD